MSPIDETADQPNLAVEFRVGRLTKLLVVMENGHWFSKLTASFNSDGESSGYQVVLEVRSSVSHLAGNFGNGHRLPLAHASLSTARLPFQTDDRLPVCWLRDDEGF